MEIKIKNVSKVIDENELLSNIDLTFTKGNIYGITGRNGSGKSILFKSLCGFIKPTTGEIIVNGINLYDKNTFPANTSALIDNSSFLNDLSGFENLELLAAINNYIGKEEIYNTLKDVGLFEEKDKKFKKYSLGMKRKLGIAQALMENDDIIILDEPFNGLDESSVEKIRNILLEIKKDKIIIIASHIKEDIAILCDCVYTLDNGKIK